MTRAWLRIFLDFVQKEAAACAFPFGVLGCLALTKVVAIPGVPRYDLVLVLCLLLQAAVLCFKLETPDEAKASLVFHACGLLLELHKVRIGSWSYPGEAWSKIGDVPLYSGFMYASVASYMHMAWRLFRLEIHGWPPQGLGIGTALLVYANFFTNHILPDLRWWILGLVLITFGRSTVRFDVGGTRLGMPLCVAFALIGGFVYLAENLATSVGAWVYPHQQNGWQLVHPGKLTSWSLLVIVTFVVVAYQKRSKLQAVPQPVS